MRFIPYVCLLGSQSNTREEIEENMQNIRAGCFNTKRLVRMYYNKLFVSVLPYVF